jgi:hypothetical protein
MQHSHTSLIAAVAHVVARLPAAPDTSFAAEEHLARRHAATRRVRPAPACDKPQSDLDLFSSSSRRLSLEPTPSMSSSKSQSMSPPSKSRPARRLWGEVPGTITSDLRALRRASCPLCLNVEKTLLPIM